MTPYQKTLLSFLVITFVISCSLLGGGGYLTSLAAQNFAGDFDPILYSSQQKASYALYGCGSAATIATIVLAIFLLKAMKQT